LPVCVASFAARAAAPAGATSAVARCGFALDVSRLDNGLTVILYRDPTAPRVSLNLCYRVGSGDETPGKTGLAHLLEHLMFEGSEHVPPGAFDAWLREAGGESNAATGEDATFYWQDLPAGALERALFLESDRMGFLAGALSVEALERQKQVIAAERDYIEEHSAFVSDEWVARPFLFPPSHPYRGPVIGRPEDLLGLSVEDLREFHGRYYRPANASLVVAGDIDVGATRDLVARWFSDIPGGAALPRRANVASAPRAGQRIVREASRSAPTLSVHWASAPASSRDDAALAVLADLLAGGPRSPLHGILVEESGLVASVSARQEGLRLGGVFSIEVEGIPGRSLDPVLPELDRAITAILDQGLTRRAVRRAREGLITRGLGELERLGGLRGLAGRINAAWAQEGRPGAFARNPEDYDSLRPSDLRKAAARWIGPRRVVVSTVPIGRRDPAAGAEEGE